MLTKEPLFLVLTPKDSWSYKGRPLAKKAVTALSLFTDVPSVAKMSLAEESCKDVWHQQHIYNALININ